ncbi:hypothetical protein DDQ50_15140 [Amnibacterium flavum]|uniref:Uncharacterized protein n=2 Tax=Amnibacterium flavum TaxID=2173173 RepID=A0A2V1HPX6_9MICO|nr:hypothetical protein DDQ50_15140 [Amnibacterium flavum]
MVITIDEYPSSLLDLLWLREALGLHPEGDDLPPLLIETPDRVIDDQADTAVWETAWPGVWDAVVRHSARIPDPEIFTALQASADASPERADLLRQLIGPSWSDQFGTAAFGAEHSSWSAAQRRSPRSRPLPYDRQPERVCLDALVPAWRAGLTKVVTIPCRGTHTRRIGDNALLMTASTREDPEGYRLALRSFAA